MFSVNTYKLLVRLCLLCSFLPTLIRLINHKPRSAYSNTSSLQVYHMTSFNALTHIDFADFYNGYIAQLLTNALFPSGVNAQCSSSYYYYCLVFCYNFWVSF